MGKSQTAKTTFIMCCWGILIICASATNHIVGGATGWNFESNMQKWTTTRVFYNGDNLEFIYNTLHDVLEVDKTSFSTCQTSDPISIHNDGNTSIPLEQPGMRYFICGSSGHCESGLKLQVDVLSNSPPSPSSVVQPRIVTMIFSLTIVHIIS